MIAAIGGETAIDSSALFTVTSNPPVAVLPARSTAVTVSCVVPTGKVAPLARGVIVTAATPLSASDGITGPSAKLTTAPAPDVAPVTMLFGSPPSSGGVLSIRTTCVLSASTLPPLSLA